MLKDTWETHMAGTFLIHGSQTVIAKEWAVSQSRRPDLHTSLTGHFKEGVHGSAHSWGNPIVGSQRPGLKSPGPSATVVLMASPALKNLCFLKGKKLSQAAPSPL